MTHDGTYKDCSFWREYNRRRPDPAARLAYYRLIVRRRREGRELNVRLRG